MRGNDSGLLSRRAACACPPQLTDAEAADHEIDDYLAGDDGWAPQAEG